MNGDKCTRWTAVAAVLAVAVVAALISYRHAVVVVTRHGEPGTVGHLYPVVIDGLIVAASMVLLDSARHDERAPVLSLWLLGAGIGATLAANVLAGVSAGVLGAIVAAWPAAAFVGCYELLMMLVRAAAKRTAPVPDAVSAAIPADAESAALLALRATTEAGNPLSQNQLMERFGLTRAAATKVRQQAMATSNGHLPPHLVIAADPHNG
jgi:MFS family permease